jgi:tRNA pseudouridine55 synthase
MFGLLNFNKPPGVTSRDVVNQVQRLVKPHKVGHAGTLDPLATGVLVVSVGPATRLMEYVQRMPKWYVGTFLLGRQSATEDVEGEVEVLENPPLPTREQIDQLLPRFLGEISQTPPAFSALKLQGRRAYELARKGAAVELAPRRVTIHELSIVSYDYPVLTLDIRCGSGTYVRSLGRDMARALGTQAVMSALERRAIGAFRVEEAVRPDALNAQNLAAHLQPPQFALSDLPTIVLNAGEKEHFRHGRTVANRFGVAAPEAAAVDEQGQLVAVARIISGLLRPALCFLSPS